MPKQIKKKSVKKDENEMAFNILNKAIKEPTKESAKDIPPKNPAAVALGRMGGLKGGHARAKALSAKKRKAIAKKAAETRWKNKKLNNL